MTIRELRNILFSVSNQSISVQDLRHKLFDIEDQDGQTTTEEICEILRKI